MSEQTNSDTVDAARLRQLLAESTQEPWTLGDEYEQSISRGSSEVRRTVFGPDVDASPDDAALIQLAPAMARALLDVQQLLDDVDDTVATEADGVHIPIYLIQSAISDALNSGGTYE
ncbi:hypothetical protein LG293_15820 (plasmid) [Citricoccus nitrophenolicus]